MSLRKQRAAIFASIFDAVAAVIGYAAALRDSVVQAARRAYVEALA